MNQRPSNSDLYQIIEENATATNFLVNNPKILHAPKVSFRKESIIPNFSLSSSSSFTDCIDKKKSKESFADLSLNIETSAESLNKYMKKAEQNDILYFTESEDEESDYEQNNIYITFENKQKSSTTANILSKLMKKNL